jgi:hypothetical protein
MHTISAATIDIFPAIFSLFCKLCLALNKTFQSRFFNIHKTRTENDIPMGKTKY